MNGSKRILILVLGGLVCLFGGRGSHLSSVYAQSNADSDDDGNVYVYASVEVDSSGYLYVDSYTALDYFADEDIALVGDEIQVDEDNDVFFDDYGDADEQFSEYATNSTSPVSPGHEYGVASIGYACYADYDEEDEDYDDCEWYPEISAYASVYHGVLAPHIASISPSSVQQGDSGTLTVTGTNLVESSTDQLTLNYSGQGMPFSPTGTPSSTSATFSYDFNGYDTGTYQISVTNNEGTSNQVNFTVNPPQNACTQSRTPNSFAMQITGLSSQGGSFTVSHPTAVKNDAATTVNYGPASTPESVASSIAAAISRKYLQFGITAQADGSNVKVQSRALFGAVSASSPNSTYNVGSPSTLSCIVPPSIPCTPLNFDYNTARPYEDGFTETPRQHIIRRHITGSPSPGLTKYETPSGSVDAKFAVVRDYNITTWLESPYVNGSYIHRFPPRVILGIEFGVIGYDYSNNPLYTNIFFLDRDTCKVNTSFPQ